MLVRGWGLLSLRTRRRSRVAGGAHLRLQCGSERRPRLYDVKPLFARFRASKPWRAWKRYGDARGNILAAGVGYFAFFSIFPAVALAFTVFGFVLGGHPELLRSIADQLNQNLPGFVKDAQHPTGVIALQAPGAPAL